MSHWKMDCDADGYVWLTIDVADKSVNVLTHAVLEELDQIIGDLVKQDNINGLVCYRVSRVDLSMVPMCGNLNCSKMPEPWQIISVLFIIP